MFERPSLVYPDKLWYTAESAYYDVVYNDTTDIKMFLSKVFSWSYITSAVTLVKYNDIGFIGCKNN